jgi:hypothetical protein
MLGESREKEQKGHLFPFRRKARRSVWLEKNKEVGQ